jgi:hypothetical protein
VIVIAPVRVPIAVGVNVAVTVQVAFCVNVDGHVLVWLKSPVAAEIEMPLIEPLLAVRVTACPPLGILRAWLAKVSEFEVNPNVVGNIPDPLKLIDCGLPVPEDVIEIAPVRVPVAVGVNVVVMEQVAFCASVVPQVVVRLKSPVAAPIEIPLIVPLLAASVTVCPALVVLVA